MSQHSRKEPPAPPRGGREGVVQVGVVGAGNDDVPDFLDPDRSAGEPAVGDDLRVAAGDGAGLALPEPLLPLRVPPADVSIPRQGRVPHLQRDAGRQRARRNRGVESPLVQAEGDHPDHAVPAPPRRVSRQARPCHAAFRGPADTPGRSPLLEDGEVGLPPERAPEYVIVIADRGYLAELAQLPRSEAPDGPGAHRANRRGAIGTILLRRQRCRQGPRDPFAVSCLARGRRVRLRATRRLGVVGVVILPPGHPGARRRTP